jgi:hypothetical protein
MSESAWPTLVPPGESSDFILGLDLGKTADYSALAVLERRWSLTPGAPKDSRRYAVRHLKRWPLKTPYPRVIEDVCALTGRPPLGCPLLGVDQTGVGQAIVDMLRQARQQGRLSCRLKPVVITGGSSVGEGDDGALHAPKKELVGALQKLLQTHRLLLADVPERERLTRELANFRVKVTASANETFEASGDHDDLVMALAIAAWLGERETPWECPTSGPPAPRAEGRSSAGLPGILAGREDRGRRLFGR